METHLTSQGIQCSINDNVSESINYWSCERGTNAAAKLMDGLDISLTASL